jgi:antitoxin HigA-1
MKKGKLLPLVTPGEILAGEFLKPLGITEYRLAKDIGVPALRFSQYFGNTPQFWLNLQTDYELRRIMRKQGLPKIGRCAQLAA